VTDAQLAMLNFWIEQMYSPPILEPALHAQLADWTVRGYITGQDALFPKLRTVTIGAQRLYYGALLERLGQYVIAVRGTAGMLEWLDDANFQFTQHSAGRVEAGFWGIYQTLMFRQPKCLDTLLIDGLKMALGKSPVLIVGHSLGSALGTFLDYELSASTQTSARFFGSPRPGDAAFAKAFHARVGDYKSYAYGLDAVPHVPIGFGYEPLPNLVTITPAAALARLRLNLGCFHHLPSYAAVLDPSAVDYSLLPPDFASCLIPLAA
jgi:hypothetical protein